MKMLGLSYNQGGVINFLGKQPEVTAPIRSQSHADSPPTQLAYITDAEKDLLVKANIHDSMDGQPNQGPAGLESLDDWSVPGSGSTQNEADKKKNDDDDDEPSDRKLDGFGGDNADARTDADAADARTDAARIREENRFKSAEKKETSPADIERNKQSLVSKLLRGDIEDDYVGDDAFKASVPKGQHKLRTQLDRLTAKFGPDFLESSQAKHLMSYLAGVPTERGGGLGSFDTNYGGDGTNIDPDSEEYRRMLLERITGPNAGVPVVAGYNEGIQKLLNERDPNIFGKDTGTYNRKLAQGNLSPVEYQNFIRQLRAADPSIGNTAYDKAFPNPLEKLLSKMLPGSLIGGALLGNEPQAESEAYGLGNRIFYDTSVPREDNSVYNDDSGIMGTQPGYDMSIYGSFIGQEGPFPANFVDQDGDGSDDRYQSGPGKVGGEQGGKLNPPIADLTPRPGVGMPDTVTHGLLGGTSNVPSGLETLVGPSLPQQNLNYANMAPQYGNQGINDPRFAQYYKNLQMFPRRA